MFRCPGQDPRFWKPEDVSDVKCAHCGQAVEFFKDEPKLKCRNCGQWVINPKIDLGCANWCRYAEQCVGPSVLKNIDALKYKIIDDMKSVFGSDLRRINHALTVLGYAEQIQAVEGGDPFIVKAAAILHDIGIHQAEKKYASSAGNYQEIEGPPIADEILRKYEISDEQREHICKIIANHHSAKDIDTIEFRIIWDADWLVNFPGDFKDADEEKCKSAITRIFKTKTGHLLACKLFLNQ